MGASSRVGVGHLRHWRHSRREARVRVGDEMIIHYDPDEWVTESDKTVCSYHQRYPGRPYAGCTCSASWGQRRATTEERKTNKIKRLKARHTELKQETWDVLADLGLLENEDLYKRLAQR